MADSDVDVVDVDEIAVDKRPTRPNPPQPKPTLKVEFDLDDPNAAAEFLEAVAKLLRERRRIVLTVD